MRNNGRLGNEKVYQGYSRLLQEFTWEFLSLHFEAFNIFLLSALSALIPENNILFSQDSRGTWRGKPPHPPLLPLLTANSESVMCCTCLFLILFALCNFHIKRNVLKKKESDKEAFQCLFVGIEKVSLWGYIYSFYARVLRRFCKISSSVKSL